MGDFWIEDENEIRLQRERVDKAVLDTYRAKRKSYHVYKAAAALWSEGVEWQTALSIIQQAFNAMTHEAEG